MATPVIVAGLPGRMAALVAELLAADSEFTVASDGLSGASHDGDLIDVVGVSVRLMGGESTARLAPPTGALAVDYTTPDAALANIGWYVEHNVPFVMGTTGFDSQAARRLVEQSSVCAVIAPNMAAPIVLLQAAARWLASEFPGALAGAGVSVRESHQAGKRDVSGTAKAMAAHLDTLGAPCPIDRIEKVRDPERQRTEVGVPTDHLEGHAFHRYQVDASEGTVGLVLEHNVLGRRVYAEGTVTALRFLRDRVAQGQRGRVYSMEDVLRHGPGGVGS